MDGTTVITTEAITIDITIAATTTGTEDGLSRSMDALGITAIGKQYTGTNHLEFRSAQSAADDSRLFDHGPSISRTRRRCAVAWRAG
jgi:hypothetical protein